MHLQQINMPKHEQWAQEGSALLHMVCTTLLAKLDTVDS